MSDSQNLWQHCNCDFIKIFLENSSFMLQICHKNFAVWNKNLQKNFNVVTVFLNQTLSLRCLDQSCMKKCQKDLLNCSKFWLSFSVSPKNYRVYSMAKPRSVDNLIGFITHSIQKFWQVFVLIFHMTLCSLVVLSFPI